MNKMDFDTFTAKHNLNEHQKTKLMVILDLLRTRENNSYIETVMPIIINSLKKINNINELNFLKELKSYMNEYDKILLESYGAVNPKEDVIIKINTYLFNKRESYIN